MSFSATLGPRETQEIVSYLLISTQATLLLQVPGGCTMFCVDFSMGLSSSWASHRKQDAFFFFTLIPKNLNRGSFFSIHIYTSNVAQGLDGNMSKSSMLTILLSIFPVLSPVWFRSSCIFLQIFAFLLKVESKAFGMFVLWFHSEWENFG